MRIPTATYRLQFNSEFKFSDAQKIIPYLKKLGISDIYASPIFKACTGSTHGYDVVDPTQLNPEIGSKEEFESLIEILHQHDLNWLQDIVPNHMAYHSQNLFLMDVLENGPKSDYYDFFDIQWEHPYRDIQGKVLAPLLGDFYGNCLENGELKLEYQESGLSVTYYHLRFPLRIESYLQVITEDLERLERSLGTKHPDFIKFLGILYLLKDANSEMSQKQYRNHLAFTKSLLWELYQSNSVINEFISTNIDTFNGNHEILDNLLSSQYFRLSFWKVGAEELNYRRFFAVNELICVSIENPEVFSKTHDLIHELIQNKSFDGVRIDHIDGLYNPKQYLERLRKHLGNVYITVEKILHPGETLPEDWPVQGTSGYEFLYHLNGLFCQKANENELIQIYRYFTGQWESYEHREIACKRLIADRNLGGDVENLANMLKEIASRYRTTRDFTLSGLRRAIVEVLVLFPIYRTYITAEGVNERYRTYVRRVIQSAKRNTSQLINELNFIEELFLLEGIENLTEEERLQRLHFVMRMQQFSGPLMAKGVEDTLFYIYNPLVSLNEVGGAPNNFGVTIAEFHAFNQQQTIYWPHSMNASSTHDTKRTEDVRARINVLSEIPQEWQTQVTTWQKMNEKYKQYSLNSIIVDSNDEYFLYQNLVGVFPFASYDHEEFVQRIKAYVIKAVREAKVHTAWLRPDTEYEDNFENFVEKLLNTGVETEFLSSLRSFQSKIAFYGMLNSLSQTLLKLTSPGVPDIYQGTEMWDLSLVDPDNRRPVDYDHRLHELEQLEKGKKRDLPSLLKNLLTYATDGRVKLYLTSQTLAALKEYQDIFQQGDYTPLTVTGKYADHVVAFQRHTGEAIAVTIVPRFLTTLVEPGKMPLGEAVWQDTTLELPLNHGGEWLEIFTQRSLSHTSKLKLGKTLDQFPVALLINRC
ncbi:malto-oligosyltrehalose synthase [Gloeocapsa sp. PCC 73106]|uniref:malto-oligosyltrehalose synthase n=1 Tax=Gloeocapsa sp. PCC 73106 TaxID=102232 RepID=UPI0002AC407F|nr:malto-oligosyltrehalose synthase [Gloeocapsa sp. PCC 73106]ELR98550.1 malto-oligosyltrehalose synthase [Gloeocapsa sp. PCC 73106]